MKTARLLCLFVILLTTWHFVLAIGGSGLHHGAGMDTFQAGYAADPWQAVINIDLMAGLLMACAWILWREDNRAIAIAWVITILWWGNLVVAAYLLRQIQLGGGHWETVLLGRNADPALRPGPRRAFGTPAKTLLLVSSAIVAGYMVWCCRSVGYSGVPALGYCWGLGSLSLALFVAALRGHVAHR